MKNNIFGYVVNLRTLLPPSDFGEVNRPGHLRSSTTVQAPLATDTAGNGGFSRGKKCPKKYGDVATRSMSNMTKSP